MTQSQFLIAAVNYLAGRKYRIISQSDQQVQLVKPKSAGCFLFGVLLLLGIWPALVYWIFEKDKSILVADQGQSIRASGGTGKVATVSYEELSAGKYAKLDVGGTGLLPFLIITGLILTIIACIIVFSFISSMQGS